MDATQDRNRPLRAVMEMAERMMLRLNGCADVMVARALIDAFREFCDRSEVWRDWVCLSARDAEGCCCQGRWRAYLPCVPAGCHVKSVFGVRADGREVPRRHWSFTDGACGGWVEVDGTWLSLGEVRRLEAWVSFVPDDDNEDIPRWMVQRWGGVIRSGALYRLFAMDGKAWSDATQARLELEAWNAGVSEAAYAGMGAAGANE